MRFTRTAAALIGVSTLAALAAPTADAASPKIIGGSEAEQVSWAVQYSANGSFGCGGSLIGAKWVLLARHCQEIPHATERTMSLLIGDNTRGRGTPRKVVKAYQRDSTHDIMLLELDKPVDTTPVKLADSNPKVGEKSTIYGWGGTTSQGGLSSRLKKANVEITAVDKNHDVYGGPSIDSKGVDGRAFHGDSGGPELNANGELVGACSGGPDETDNIHAEEWYSSVPANREWIKQVSGI